ncbi:TPA: hypothetical protein N0F65_001293, partial [Lagenidium giganteum]
STEAIGRLGTSPAELDTLSGRVGEAIDLYVDLLRVYKRFPHVHFKLGYLFLAIHDYLNAIRHFTFEIERYSIVARNEGASTQTDNQTDDSVAEAGQQSPAKASEEPISSEAYVQQRTFLLCAYSGRSEAYLGLKEDVKAEKDLLYIDNRGGSNAQSLIAMGSLFRHFGMHQRADAFFDKCSALDATNPELLIEQAELRLAQRRLGNASQLFEKCRSICHSSSPIYHRALIGEGVTLVRLNKHQEAVILLLQAMNSLRVLIRQHDQSILQGTVLRDDHAAYTSELSYLYNHATNVYGGLCLMKGELKTALDTYFAVLQNGGLAANDNRFHLPTICVLPGTKTQHGELVDSTKISTKNLGEVIRHLNEIEWRYGPDACLYFHRANIHRALGELEHFVRDLSLVETIDPNFLKTYHLRDDFGDYLDVETISWIPMKFIEEIHRSIERNDYKIPSLTSSMAAAAAPPSPTPASPRTRQSIRRKHKSTADDTSVAVAPRHPSFSEPAILAYLQERIKYASLSDEYAQVFQVDVLRRVPKGHFAESLRHCEGHYLSQWEGISLDEPERLTASRAERDGDTGNHVREQAKQVVAKYGRNPSVHMLAGIVELDLFNASQAHAYFTEAISLVDAILETTHNQAPHERMSALAKSWHDDVLSRVKFYCYIWRSMANRIRIEMESAVEDLNLAAAIPFPDMTQGGNDPLLLVQRTIIMFLNGHLKSAYKLLRQLDKEVKRARKRRSKGKERIEHEVTEMLDMLSHVGLNSFHLLPPQLEQEFARMSAVPALQVLGARADPSDSEAKDDDDDDVTSLDSIAQMAIHKKHVRPGASVVQTETLDRFYDSGILKLATTGSIAQSGPFFQAILTMEDSYLAPTNFASLELFKCKEQEYMEEKLYACFVRLGKRSKWLQKKVKWRYEALIDANLAHAYLPTDMDTLWHRARLLQEQKNYASAIYDIASCIELMSAHVTWKTSKKSPGNQKAEFTNEAKRTQWLQLQLERGLLEMELKHWDRAIECLTMVISQSGKTNRVIEGRAYEARSNSYINLHRYGHAVQDLQVLLAGNGDKRSAEDEFRRKEDNLLNNILIGNLYCQLAVDQMKTSANVGQTQTSFTPWANKSSRTANLNLGFISRASEYYEQALRQHPDHFLVHFFLGRMHALAAESKQAIQCLSDCLKIHPIFLPALFLRGCIYAQENLGMLALADFFRVRHRFSSYPRLHTSIGFCYFERGNMTKAIEALTEALIQDADDIDALYMRGCALQELLVLENAIKDFSRVIVLKSDHHRAYFQRGVCYLLLQDYNVATSDIDRALKVHPEWKEAWHVFGYALFCSEKYDDAVLAYGKAIGLYDNESQYRRESTASSRNSMLFLHRGLSNMHGGNLTGALADIELALKRDNENYLAFLAMGYCHMKLGDNDKAIQALAHALPNHKKIALMPVTDVIEAERIKMMKRESHGIEAHATSVINAFTSPSQASPNKFAVNELKGPLISANAGVLFYSRRDLRDQAAEAHLQAVSTNVGGNAGVAVQASPAPPAPSTPTKAKRFASTVRRASFSRSLVANAMAGEKGQKLTETLDVLKKRERKSKLLRAMKKLMFEHRVLKALEGATRSKHKKNQQFSRVLREVMNPVNKIPWPKGTLTSNVLVWAFNALGVSHLQRQSVDDALMAFTLAIQAHPNNPVTYFNRGNVYLHMDVPSSAVNGYLDAVDVEEDYFRAQNNMGVAYFQMKRMDEAQESFATGLFHAQEPKHKAILLYNLGVVYQLMDKPDEAMDYYQQAIALDNSRAEFFNNRSSMLHQQLKFNVALEDYNRALQLHETPLAGAKGDGEKKVANRCVEARLNRAQLFIATGYCTSAIRDLLLVLEALAELREQRIRQTQTLKSGGAQQVSSINKNCGETEEALANELLQFCRQWREALRIAVKDFLFALHAFPCFARFNVYPVFGPELAMPTDVKESRRLELGDHQTILPFPVSDQSFFDFDRDFCQPHVMDEAAESNCNSSILARHFDQPYGPDLRVAIRCFQQQDIGEALRYLLRAHYKTDLGSHEEYLMMISRVQVTLSVGESSEPLEKAITMLSDFLAERQTKDEIDSLTGESIDGDHSKPKRMLRTRLSASMLFNDDGDELSQADLQWRYQRRVIRADAYCYLGCLQQLNSQRQEAMQSFVRCLSLRSDHAIALINYLQLSVSNEEYESCLDGILQILQLLLSHVDPAEATSGLIDEPDIKTMGLLGTDRSVQAMIPGIENSFVDERVEDIARQMLQLMKDYRCMLSAQVQSSTIHIFKKQGALAKLIQILRQHLGGTSTNQDEDCLSDTDCEQENHSNAGLGAPAASSGDRHDSLGMQLKLSEFNRIVDSCTMQILKTPSEYASDSEFLRCQSQFEAEFAEVCAEVIQSLPPETLDDVSSFIKYDVGPETHHQQNPAAQPMKLVRREIEDVRVAGGGGENSVGLPSAVAVSNPRRPRSTPSTSSQVHVHFVPHREWDMTIDVVWFGVATKGKHLSLIESFIRSYDQTFTDASRPQENWSHHVCSQTYKIDDN